MGYPLYSNIFAEGSRQAEYFSRFPVQVAVLFSPKDEEFSKTFREIFIRLDRMTGEKVAFFSVLDPPADWLEVARERPWWREYSDRVGKLGFSFDDDVLVNELTRAFGLRWEDLPVLIISTNLWREQIMVIPTSAADIEHQFSGLSSLAYEYKRDNRPIFEYFWGMRGWWPLRSIEYRQRIHPRAKLRNIYLALESFEGLKHKSSEAFYSILGKALKYVDRTLREPRNQPLLAEENEAATDKYLDNTLARLIVPATVALKFTEKLNREVSEDLEAFDNESQIMISSSLRVKMLLELIDSGQLQIDIPLSDTTTPEAKKKSQHILWKKPIDYTPGTQGLWKAFEREINLSVIQAARLARDVPMPSYFAKYFPSLPAGREKVRTGKERYKNINECDRYSTLPTDRHRFLPLGDALVVTETLQNDPLERFNQEIVSCLGTALPPDLLTAWKNIHAIRNKGSHVSPIEKADSDTVQEAVLSDAVIKPLTTIKNKLSGKTP